MVQVLRSRTPRMFPPESHTSDSSGRMCVKNNLRSCHFIFATCSRRFVAERKPVNLINFTSFFCSHVFGNSSGWFSLLLGWFRGWQAKISAPRKLKPANKERQSILVQLNALLITFVGILYIIVLCHTRRCRFSSQGRVWKLTTHSCQLFDKKTLHGNISVRWWNEFNLD